MSNVTNPLTVSLALAWTPQLKWSRTRKQQCGFVFCSIHVVNVCRYSVIHQISSD